jgi:iron complex outermembrane receptor protein
VELLKGAASVLYGASAPGGVLNTVSKRPGPDMLREVRAGIGNMGQREAAFDLGGAVAPDSAWSWRLTGLARNGDTHIDHIPSKGRYIAPAVTWRPDAATSLTLLGYHQERRTAYYYPLPAEGTLVASPYGRLPRQRFVGEPDFDREDTRQSAFGWLFEHAFSDAVKLRHGLRWIKSSNRVRFTGLDGWVDEAAPRAQYRTAYDELESTSGLSSDTSVEYRVQTGAVAHTLLAGIDASRLRPHSQWSFAELAPLDLYAPVYGAQPGPMTLAPSYSQRTVQTRKGLYLQDQMKIGQRWVLLLGGPPKATAPSPAAPVRSTWPTAAWRRS